MKHRNGIRVWDPLIRLFHWTLVLAFFTAYLTEGEPEWLHVWAGYLIAGLLAVRLVWGFVGSEHARFTDFVRSPRVVAHYLRDELAGRARRYLGHNPAGGAMILALLFALAVTALSGMTLLAPEEGEGPLAGWLVPAPAEQTMVSGGHAPERALAENVEELHEFFANLTLLLVGLHVLGVLVESVRHRENLVRAMITGYKRE